MARPLRIEFEGAVYHVTARGNARDAIYLSDADREMFLDTLAHVVDRFGWICHAYCLMSNHFHLMIETPQANLSRGMRQLNGLYTGSTPFPQRLFVANATSLPLLQCAGDLRRYTKFNIETKRK